MMKPAPSSISATRATFKASFAIAAIIGALLLCDRLLGAALDVAYSHSGASPIAIVRSSAADTVVVGTSSAKYSINPAAWPGRLVNLAQDGQTVLFSIAAARAISIEAPEVKRIVIGLDPYDLSSGVENPSASRVWRIAPLLATRAELAPLLWQTRPEKSMPLPLYSWRYRGEVPKIVSQLGKTTPPPFKALDVGKVTEPPSSDEPTLRSIHASMKSYIDVLSDTARRVSPQIVLVITPAYKDRRWNHRDQSALISELRERLAGAPFCDLMTSDTPALERLRSDPTNFHDGIHLTLAGASAFTGELHRLVTERCGTANGAAGGD